MLINRNAFSSIIKQKKDVEKLFAGSEVHEYVCVVYGCVVSIYVDESTFACLSECFREGLGFIYMGIRRLFTQTITHISRNVFFLFE